MHNNKLSEETYYKTFIGILFCCLLTTFVLYAQSTSSTPLRPFKGKNGGKAKIELIYQHDGIDPISKKYGGTEFILQIGDTLSLFLPYNRYKNDSVLVAWEGKNKTYKDFLDFPSDRPNTIKELLIRNKKQNTILLNDFIAGSNYYYVEPIPHLNWKLHKETRNLHGRECRKATLNYAGRKWTAWYDPKLPISEGPWKFHGLPGAIVRISDSIGSHTFELMQVRPKGTSILVPSRTRPQKVLRKELDKLRALYATNPGAVFGNSPLAPRDLNGRVKKLPVRKRIDVYINPLHLD